MCRSGELRRAPRHVLQAKVQCGIGPQHEPKFVELDVAKAEDCFRIGALFYKLHIGGVTAKGKLMKRL